MGVHSFTLAQEPVKRPSRMLRDRDGGGSRLEDSSSVSQLFAPYHAVQGLASFSNFAAAGIFWEQAASSETGVSSDRRRSLQRAVSTTQTALQLA